MLTASFCQQSPRLFRQSASVVREI
jgi:hypothetical protein